MLCRLRCCFPRQRELPPGGDSTREDVEEALAADEARQQAAMAVPLPEGSRWHEIGGDELERHFAYTDVIDAAWLLKFANGEVMPDLKGVVPAWQHVPPEAKVSLETLRRTTMLDILPVAVVSYPWAARRHPDPSGALLRRLKPALEAMVRSCEHGLSHGQKPTAWGIVWDWMSLPQSHASGSQGSCDERTPYELARFGRGLKAINVWYAAMHVSTLVCDWPMPEDAENITPIDRRGWCIFERRISSVRKHARCCLHLSHLPPPSAEPLNWAQIMQSCKVGRLPPLAPPILGSWRPI